jgi:hypothetical protein
VISRCFRNSRRVTRFSTNEWPQRLRGTASRHAHSRAVRCSCFASLHRP